MAQPAGTLDRAIEHHRAGRFAQAIEQYRAALRFGNPPPGTHLMLADALWSSGQIEAAIEALRQGVRANPGDRGARSALAGALVSHGRHTEAIRLRAESVGVHRAGQAGIIARLELAEQCLAARRTSEALAAVESALELDGACVAALAERARLFDRLGRDEEAHAAAEALRRVARDHPTGAVTLARLKSRAGDWAGAIAIVRRAIENNAAERTPPLHIELGRLLDREGDYAGAFKAAADAHAADAAHGTAHTGRPDPHMAVLEACIRDVRAESVAAWPRPEPDGVAIEPPVFVVGFPRSGTTLIEQMLSAHPRLRVTDEAPFLQGAREEMFALFSPRGAFPADLGSLTARQAGLGVRSYARRAADLLGEDPARRIVDKNPLNVADLCTARLIFPDAPVIFVQRDPRDACLSCFLQGFSRGVRMLRSLDGICRFFDAIQRTREHLAQTLGQRVLEIRYEDVVADPGAAARRMIGFVGEPWDDAVLRYFEDRHARYIVTPSFRDVRSPVHSRAAGRWRSYRAQLAPVLPALTGWATRLGYPAE